MVNHPLPRLDKDAELRKLLMPCCRLKRGEIWEDPQGMHKVGCLDAAERDELSLLLKGKKAALAVHDPPYNFVAFEERELDSFIRWCKVWIQNTFFFLKKNSSMYVWLGADQNNHFQPLSDFITMMRSTKFKSKSFITVRNQRGYGTQKNWMSVRQELLFYVKGNPEFFIDGERTDIPKILRGYYKEVNGSITENLERSHSKNIRAGNVWVDIQQVFYRMEENVNGCYAQKPLKSIERIILSGTEESDLVIDFFSHSGTSLLAAEMHDRKCFASDIDPIFCEISIRRLENFRLNGRKGWQNSNPFAKEISNDKRLRRYLSDYYMS